MKTTKTPDEIKKGLECCPEGRCKECPFPRHRADCSDELLYAAHACIQQIEAQVPKWISFSEAIPPEHERVLCLGTYNGEPHVYIDLVMTFGVTVFAELYDPTHWMPLPEPPKEDDHATD